MNQPLHPEHQPEHARQQPHRPGHAGPPRRSRWTLALSVLSLAAGLGLAACQPKPENSGAGPAAQAEPTVGQRIDEAMARSSERVEQARDEAAQAVQQAGTAITDAAITAGVNAKLAADEELSALRINVETQQGRVALSGDAPSMAARERATELAGSVEGVLAVDNRLTLQPRG